MIHTIMITFILTLIAVGLLAIGWLLTGRAISRGSCGIDPTKKRDSCKTDSACHICGKKDEK